MKNRKGFTIIELLAVITVLGLLVVIAIPAINKELAKFRIRYYKQVENTVKVAGQDYVDDKRFSRPTKLLYSKVVKVNDLVDKNYMEQIKDYNKKACDNEADSYSYFVMVKTGDKKYEYQSCVKCSDDEYYTDTSGTEFDLCNPAWLTNEYISYGGIASSDEVLWVYYGSSEREIEEQVGIKYGITKKDNKGNLVAKIEDTNAKIVYPDNINELVTGNLDQIVTLRYTMPDGETVTRKAGLFRYGVPSVTLTYTNANPYSGKSAGTAYGSGSDEWANGITLTVGYNATDKEKYNDFIHDSNNHISKIEYYSSVDHTWKTFNCVASSKESCTVTLTDNFNGTMKFRLVDSEGRATKETTSYNIKIDKDKPTCTVTTSGTTGSNGWYKSDVTITMNSKSDALSGLGKYGVGQSKVYDNTTSKVHKNDGSSITYNGYVVDKAGNENTCSVTFKRDATKPTCTLKITSGTAGVESWYRSNIGIDFNTLSDATSDLDGYDLTTSTTATYNNTRNKTQTADTSTSGQVWYGYVKDKAGNINSCSITVKKDTIKPTCTIKVTSGTLGNNSWYKTNVGITATFNDALSGVNQKGIGSYDNRTTLTHSADTASVTYTGKVQDKAGNEQTCSVTFKKDSTKPTCTIAKTNTNYTTGVNLTATCSDSTSLCTATTQTANGQKSSKTFTFTDNAGNSGTCTMAVSSGTRYRTRTCNTYTYCAHSNCGSNYRRTTKKCNRSTKNCTASTCSYSSCSCSYSCPAGFVSYGSQCVRVIAGSDVCISRCSTCAYYYTSGSTKYYLGINSGNAYCTRAQTVTPSGTYYTYGFGTSASTTVTDCSNNTFDCNSSHVNQTHTTCTWLSYQSCRTAGCGCDSWNSWNGSSTYYPDSSCSASTNVRQCSSATVYW